VYQNLLFEIGVEELPPGFINPALKQLREKAERLFGKYRLYVGSYRVEGTPRRLILCVQNLVSRQADLVREHRGPAKRIAFDKNGNPTKAAIGFARGKGKTVHDLIVKQTPKGKYIAVVQKESGKPTEELLPELLKKLLQSLTFPKTMRWGRHEIRFARPISWLLALFGEEPVTFQIDRIESGRVTYGHRWISPGPFAVKNADHYFEIMEQAGVCYDMAQRKQRTLSEMRDAAQKHDMELVENPALLDTVSNIVEIPHAVVGCFHTDFLELPDEMIITAIERHQKCFALRLPDGRLAPKFIQVSNSDPKNDDNVRVGSERVIAARLADARFFYLEDCKTPLSEKTLLLKNVIFQKDLGSIYEKVERMKSICKKLSESLSLSPEEKANSLRAAHLAKADLVSNMIGEKEFAKLQGFMGWKYAEMDGEHPAVAQAIFEHYMPRYANDQLPETIEGAVTSLADKFDTITGCFGVGITPTGSQDPYALRRAALGIVRIILDREFDLSLQSILDHALERLQGKLKQSADETLKNIEGFFRRRLDSILREEGFDYDITDAALTISFDNFIDTRKRAKAIQNMRRHPDFDSIATANKRVTNILKKTGVSSKLYQKVDPNKFDQEEEKALYRAYQEKRSIVEQHIDERAYDRALGLLVELRQPIDNFFDHVFVMVEDQGVRNNRLALMREIKRTFDRIADFSRIVVSAE